jgi:hypothetical protein
MMEIWSNAQNRAVSCVIFVSSNTGYKLKYLKGGVISYFRNFFYFQLPIFEILHYIYGPEITKWIKI